MALHSSVKQSFFTRFVLWTLIVGNIYMFLQAAVHTFNFHGLDLYVRWYAFKAAPAFNLLLAAGTGCTLLGARKIMKHGIRGFQLYLLGKLITLLAFIVLTVVEYKISSLPYPLVLLPVLAGVEAIYPMVLYISLRQSKAGKA